MSRRRSVSMSMTSYPYPLSSVTRSISQEQISCLRSYGGSRDDETNETDETDETDANDLMDHGRWRMTIDTAVGEGGRGGGGEWESAGVALRPHL